MERTSKWFGVAVLAVWGYFAFVRPKPAPKPIILDTHAGDIGFDLLGREKPQPLNMPAYNASLESQVPASLRVVRAQPAVYRIMIYGNTSITEPKRILVDAEGLQALWLKVDSGGTNISRSDFFWVQIIAHPEKFLSVADELTIQLDQPNGLMATATGFMVSQEGIFVTNAHVVSDCGPERVSNDPEVLRSLFGESVNAWIPKLSEVVGGSPAPQQEKELADVMLMYLRNHSILQGKFTRCTLALQLAKKQLAPEQFVKMTTAEYLARPKETIEAPLTVLAKGEPLPGCDYAILRASAGDFDPVNRGVSLPLGDSDDVLPGTRVQAIGFPGVSYNDRMMQPEAQYRCSVEDGQIANTKPMNNDWTAFEMTADINHGDSGGPVLDEAGNVIAINVGSAQGASGHTLAVPINYVKRQLKQLNITPQPGKVTALWVDALAAYGAGDYERAAKNLGGLREIQAGVRDLDGTRLDQFQVMSSIFSEKVNPYVNEMAGRVYSKTHK